MENLDLSLPVPHVDVIRRLAARAFFRRVLRGTPIATDENTKSGKRGSLRGAPVIEVRNPREFYSRMAAGAGVGFGEAYMAGDWSCDDLVDVLTPMARNMRAVVPRVPAFVGRMIRPRDDSEKNTPSGVRRNVTRHYDLPYQLFSAFLDETMSYSCGLFLDSQETLEMAQINKIERILDVASVRSGSQVLEIGGGWGRLAVEAAGRGAEVVSLNVSQSQLEFARKLVEARADGMAVQFVDRDYREIDDTYDSIISVEMLEAVGAEYLPVYFQKLQSLLKPSGIVALQFIYTSEARVLRSGGQTWARKYIFPGGFIPSLAMVDDYTVGALGWVKTYEAHLGEHYAETLRMWRARFRVNREMLQGHFEETFLRMWEYYLSYCEAGFRSGDIGLVQLGFCSR